MRTTGKQVSSSTGASSGRWTASEHAKFLKALNMYGREWKKVSSFIKTRTSAQIRSHAQKYFTRLEKEASIGMHGGAAEIHGPHVVLVDDGKSGRRKKRSCGATKSSGALASEETGPSAKKARKRKKKKNNNPSPSIGKDATNASPFRSAGCGDLFPLNPLQQQYGSSPYMQNSISHPSPNLGSTGTSCPQEGRTSPVTMERAAPGSQSPKTALSIAPAQQLYANVTEAEALSALLRLRERLLRTAAIQAPHGMFSNRNKVLSAALKQRVQKIDRKLLCIYGSTSLRDICVCQLPHHASYCQSCNRDGCITAKRDLLSLIQGSIQAFSAVRTAEGEKIVEHWKATQALFQQLEVASGGLSIHNTADIFSRMSEKAQSSLQKLCVEELTAIQVLVGTKMGIKPRRSPIRMGDSSKNLSSDACEATASLPRAITPILFAS